MPDIIPSTVVRVLKNVPLDNTYSDTLYFESIGTQTSYFAGKAKYSYTNFTYQRVNSSVAMPRKALTVRVPEVADNLYDCNYIMFQNSNYGTKWFYAFIRKVNYINPNNTEIEYEIDYYQTYMFDITIRPSFVLREHSETDELYENLMPEPISEADMRCWYVDEYDLQTTSPKIVIGVNQDVNGDLVAGDTVYGGVYSGCKLYEFDTAAAANGFITTYQNSAKLDAIVAVFMCPFPISGIPLQAHNVNRPQAINSYVPRNKKLLTYPFVKMILTNRQGQNYDFYYEGFASYTGDVVSVGTIQFNTIAYGGLQPKAFCVAVGYNGFNGSVNMDYDKVCEISNFPQCAWTGNAFMNWLTGDGIASALNIGLDAIYNITGSTIGAGQSVALSAVTGDMAGAASAGISGAQSITGSYLDTAKRVGQLEIEAWSRSRCPGITKGIAHGTQLNMAMNNVGFSIKHMAINPKLAASIDDFFDMYGYATNVVKIPNMTGRESWNYVKTYDVIIDGSVPVEGMAIIKNMFNNGVRFWHGDFVGDYSRSNRPIAEV